MVQRDSFFVDRRIAALITALLALVLLAGPAFANEHLPSTNDENRTNGWAHVNQPSMEIGETELEFVSTRAFSSCFEYRADGDETQKIGETNYNPAVTDGLYPFVCLNDETQTRMLDADDFVEVRMVFGAETDERFDWTRFEVLPDAASKGDCANGGWEDFGFANQGQCNRFVNGGGDSRR